MITLCVMICAAAAYLVLKLTGRADGNGFAVSFRIGGGER